MVNIISAEKSENVTLHNESFRPDRKPSFRLFEQDSTSPIIILGVSRPKPIYFEINILCNRL